MDIKDLHQKLTAQFSDDVLELKMPAEGSKSDLFIEVKPEKIHAVCKFLKEADELRFEKIECISGVDMKVHFEVVYHLFSFISKEIVEIKTALSDREKPVIDTVSDLWKGANWLEREVYDMYGITFNNHPDLRRILCPDDWEGYPLRKNYKHQETWHGIPVGM